ncbi:HERC1 [Symbiodinium natans]|uniref:HERC1 protein n=1 Tax=Symbiodinium natans TaxID=878477 RepID=A0A812UN79_9DINO|nr:HERC1 [Symbiodinium natans]
MATRTSLPANRRTAKVPLLHSPSGRCRATKGQSPPPVQPRHAASTSDLHQVRRCTAAPRPVDARLPGRPVSPAVAVRVSSPRRPGASSGSPTLSRLPWRPGLSSGGSPPRQARAASGTPATRSAARSISPKMSGNGPSPTASRVRDTTPRRPQREQGYQFLHVEPPWPPSAPVESGPLCELEKPKWSQNVHVPQRHSESFTQLRSSRPSWSRDFREPTLPTKAPSGVPREIGCRDAVRTAAALILQRFWRQRRRPKLRKPARAHHRRCASNLLFPKRPGVYVHFAALRIQRAWRISRWRRAFALYAEHQAGWVGSLDWLHQNNMIYGTELAEKEDEEEWCHEKFVAAPDAEVDPWGNNQLRQHLQKTWDRDSGSKEAKPSEMKPKAHIVAGVHVSPSSGQYRQLAQPSQPPHLKRPVGARSRSPEERGVAGALERDLEGSVAQLPPHLQKPISNNGNKSPTEVPRKESQQAEAKLKTVSPTAAAVAAGAQRLSSTSERFVAGIPASRRLSFTQSSQLIHTMPPPSIATAAALLSPRCEQRGLVEALPVGKAPAPSAWFGGLCASGAPPHSPKSPVTLPKSPPTTTGPGLPAAVNRSPSASHRTVHAVPVTHALASLPLRPRPVSPAPMPAVQAWLPVRSRLSCRSLHASSSFAASNAFVVVSQN